MPSVVIFNTWSESGALATKLLRPAPMRPPFLSLAPFLIAQALAAGACTPDLDRNDGEAALAKRPALAALPDVDRIAYRAGAVSFVAGDLGVDTGAVADVFDIEPASLALADARVDRLGMTQQRFTQTRAGLPVIGGDLRVISDEDGTIRAAVGVAWGDAAVVTDATVAAADARVTALEVTAGGTASSAAELVYVAPSSGGAPVLAWRSRVTGHQVDGTPIVDDVFIDARSGALVDRHPHVYTARNRTTYDALGGDSFDPASPARSEGDAAIGDTDVDNAHDAAGHTYDCLSELFGRDSFDDLGSEIISVAHFDDTPGDGQPLLNAFWSGQLMAYGEGFAIEDVGTHELGHAVTEFSANLVYMNESGALNEAMSDIYAALCDAHDYGVSEATWTIGEDVDAGPIVGPLRWMYDPAMDGISSQHYSQRWAVRYNQLMCGDSPCTADFDNGGVHLDSGIANLAFYLLSEGGTHPRQLSDQEVVGVGVDDAAQIFYRAETSYFTMTTGFAAARAATEQAASDLFGEGSSEQISVSEAWFAVGVGAAPPDRSDTTNPDDGTDPGDGGDGGDTDPTDPGGGGGGGGGCAVAAGGGGGAGALVWLLGIVAVLPRRRLRRR